MNEEKALPLWVYPANVAAAVGFTGWIGYCLIRKVLREIWRP